MTLNCLVSSKSLLLLIAGVVDNMVVVEVVVDEVAVVIDVVDSTLVVSEVANVLLMVDEMYVDDICDVVVDNEDAVVDDVESGSGSKKGKYVKQAFDFTFYSIVCTCKHV